MNLQIHCTHCNTSLAQVGEELYSDSVAEPDGIWLPRRRGNGRPVQPGHWPGDWFCDWECVAGWAASLAARDAIPEQDRPLTDRPQV